MDEQARDELAVGAHDRQVAGAHLGRGVLELDGEPPARGVERLVEGDELGGRLGATGRGQVEQVVDEALRALGAGRQPAQGVAQLGIALAALLEHDEVAAQERDGLAELVSGLGRVGVEVSLGAAVGRRRGAHASASPSRTSPDAQAGRGLDGLLARAHAELAKDALDVRADGLDRQHERVGDVVGRALLAEQVEDLPLARRERAADRAHARAVLAHAAHPFDQAHRQRARDDGLAVLRAAQCARQRVDADALAQEAGGSRAQRHEADLLAVGGGEHHHPHLGRLVDDLARGGDTVHARHDEVHDHDVGLVVDAQLDGLASAPSFGDDRDPRVLQHIAQHPAREWVVIDDDDLQWLVVAMRARALEFLLRHVSPRSLPLA